jgi:hypothetical protein
MFRKILHFFRRLLGTAQILQQQEQWQQKQEWQQQQQQRALLMLGNMLKHSSAGLEKIKTTPTYKRCAGIISLLSPMDVKDGKFVRIGRSFDGGYIMLDNFQTEKIDAAYSYGINNDVSWDEDIANRGIDVFMFDHTIEQLPKHHPKFHFFKIGLTGHKKGANLNTLEECIAKNGHTRCRNLIMKMDIEGCEWDVFKEISADVLNQFSQIVVEFHNLSSAVYDQKESLITDVLKKINQTHQSIHVHANSALFPLWVGDLVIPELLEVTYIRRIDVKEKLIRNTREFPTEIDQPNLERLPDIYLGNFSVDRPA